MTVLLKILAHIGFI